MICLFYYFKLTRRNSCDPTKWFFDTVLVDLTNFFQEYFVWPGRFFWWLYKMLIMITIVRWKILMYIFITQVLRFQWWIRFFQEWHRDVRRESTYLSKRRSKPEKLHDWEQNPLSNKRNNYLKMFQTFLSWRCQDFLLSTVFLMQESVRFWLTTKSLLRMAFL